jgi:small subunit ribosomal protein S20
MGASGSELKRVRQSRRNNLRNRHYKSMMKTSIKKVLEADKKAAPTLLNQAISIIDRVCGKGIIHKNRASHQKSKLTKYINSL